MRTATVSAIFIPEERQRKEGKDSKALTELKADIAKNGLYHAPILTQSLELVAGERRFLAMKELHEEGLTFYHDGEPVPKWEIPYTRLIDGLNITEIEFHENIKRLNLTWQEENLARVKLHQMLKAENPEQTLQDTAEKIVKMEEKPVASVQGERVKLVQMHTVARSMHIPAVAEAPNLRTAYKVAVDLQKRELERELIKLRPASAPHKLIHGDCREVMKTLDPNTFDIIFSDPPYGINAHKNDDGTQHNYDDSPGYALDLYRFILSRGFELLKPQGAVFLFCDIEHFTAIRLMAEQQAYSTWRTPIIWHKGNEGHAPWGRDGFKRTYEICLYAVKGQRPLALPGGSDVKLVTRPTHNVNKMHAAEKPPELLRWFMQMTCRTGDKVLDPCCGSAPIFPAAKGLNLHITAIEKNEDYHGAASSRLVSLDQEDAPPEHISHKPTMTELLGDMMNDDE